MLYGDMASVFIFFALYKLNLLAYI